MQITPKPLVLRSALQTIAENALPATTRLEMEVPDDLAALADPLALDRILSNLLINASRYGAPPIRLSAEQSDTHIRIAVSDQGSGVPEQLRTHLFERFERGNENSGSGLGLSIARAYAQAHGGDLLYHHSKTGHSFELILPAS
jgi:signal transduction histidine kinase